jgi:surface antigen
MHKTVFVLGMLAALATPAAFADRDDHEHGHGHGHGKGHGKHKEVYWDGHCKVERKWKHGEYEEKRKCHAPEQKVVVVPAPPPPAQRVVVVPWMQQQQGGYVYKQQHRPVQVAGTTQCNSRAVGSVVGGIVGGVLGNQIGKGNGRTAATIGGAVAGVLVGGEVGRRMDAADQACVGQVLEVAPAGRRVQWAEGPSNYVVVPGQVAMRKGAYCRPYTLEMRTDRGWERTQGTACRRPDGVWTSA